MRVACVAALLMSLCIPICCGGLGMDAVYATWTTSSLEKVFRDAPIKALETPSISAARGEHEAFQVVLKAGRTKLENVTVSVSPLRSKNGRISASNVSLYLPAYVRLPRFDKDYPDALPPYRGPFTVDRGRAQPIWVDVSVPRNAKPGDYTGSITVAPSNGTPTRVPFNLHVYKFQLPVEPKLTTAFGFYIGEVARYHGVDSGSKEGLELHKKYYEFLLERGVSTYYVPGDIMSADADKYLKDPRMTSFVIPYSTQEDEQRKTLDRVRSSGAWDKGFFYFLDEPVEEEQYKKLMEGCDYLRKIDPKVRIVSPYFTKPRFGENKSVYDLLTGYINIWCCLTEFFDEKALDIRRKAGDTIWSYVCCGPGEPYCNFFVEYPVIQHRMLFWQNYLYDVSGLLYWSTTYWTKTKDPWTDINTWGDIYGDGSLVYPGKAVGIDGPVSSIRLEAIRDGLEDYAYLWLLERKIGREKALDYVKKLTQNWTTYARDPALFGSIRDRIARKIESAR